jgi:hypothetical protein
LTSAIELVPRSLTGTGGVCVTISARAALYGRDDTSADELIAAADAAMFSDKRNHKTEVVAP